ncbi:MAG: hypothetical protein A3C55_03870 [Gammaproteobacteria bacterium RIFCSPHIGHO2_02_FULL_42_13]|nr:MAG: hypothetical protein A3C55_03870 [Gammaproteobacteria bacterium RIFCSPHIGHO2_02_FULL_42_13]OGT67922.1 MAG: hypothetical protein A3H43_02350 [Gammaproteobacteria bacterium RIFCSPLOWO2_02_FULL_42_9]
MCNQRVYKKAIFTAITGDVFTLYNFAIFGYLAPVIGQIFFPASKPIIAITKVFLLYAVGYVFRPIGGVILSHIGDKYGRRISLTISFLAMGLASCVMGLLPTYEKIGCYSTLIFILMRIIQGLSTGGELSSASSYIYELANKRKGFWVSLNSAAAIFGVFLGSFTIMVLSSLFTPQHLMNYGWRIPFLLGAILVIPGIFLIKYLPESRSFEKIVQNKELERLPMICVFRNHWINMLSVFLFGATMVLVPLIFVWMPPYVSACFGKTISHVTIINTITLLVLVLLVPVAGYLSDRVGYLKLASVSVILMIILTVPLFYLITSHWQFGLLTAQLAFAIIFSGASGATSIVMTKQFPTKVRCSGIAISYNAANLVFGGTAPAVCTFLISITNLQTAPAYYITLCMMVALLGCLMIGFQKGA